MRGPSINVLFEEADLGRHASSEVINGLCCTKGLLQKESPKGRIQANRLGSFGKQLA